MAEHLQNISQNPEPEPCSENSEKCLPGIKSGSNKIFANKILAAVLVINTSIVGLGAFSEAVGLISHSYNYIVSLFSHRVEYNKLAKIHIGNTKEYAEKQFGMAQVSRAINDSVTAHYFYHRKFLLTLFYKDNTVVAYTVLALSKDFHPEVERNRKLKLGQFSYQHFSPRIERYAVDHSVVISFYLEQIEHGRSKLFLSSYAGQLNYGAGAASDFIARLYGKTVFGGGEKDNSMLDQLRRQSKPNFYGEGRLPLAVIEKSLLGSSEFTSYFN